MKRPVDSDAEFALRWKNT